MGAECFSSHLIAFVILICAHSSNLIAYVLVLYRPLSGPPPYPDQLVFVIAIVCYAMGIVSWLALVRGRPEALDAHEQHEYAQATDESASAGLR